MMKFFLLAAVLAVSSALELTHPEWLSFKQSYGKRYQNPEEEQLRFNIFLKNKNMIQEHNQKFEAGQVSYKLRINHLADLSDEEFKNLRGYNHSLKKSSGVAFIAPENLAAPSSLDWRQKGAVTPVKNQGQCGSCWAFSTTGSLEGQLFRKTGKLVSLSEQQLVDCSTENDGCNGGLMDYGFEYIKESGIESESAYPYEGEDERCRFKSSKVVGRDTGYVDIQSGSEAELLKAVASVGPISVAIDAGQNSFQFYDSGVYYERRCSSSQLDHGVLLVGYGTENGQDYWLVKNSWGPSWGQSGYIKMARNKNNHCGIATQASYPLV